MWHDLQAIIYYITDPTEMLESEIDKWHDKQVKREDALREVEDMVA